MPRPRVFVSSTYYDLKSVRAELDNFINTIGYDAVRHEVGQIAYGNEEKPEKYAIKEIDTCDILISIIGGKFGTQAIGSNYSISQEELKRAHSLNKHVFIFIERSVHSEFNYYRANKDVPGVRYTAVDNARVYEFIEEVNQLSHGNPIFSFDTGLEITSILREQWAGLMQRLIAQEANKSQSNLIEELQRSLQTVDKLVQFLKLENQKGAEAINEIIFSNHPIFKAIQDATRNKYRIYFANLGELNAWADAARSYLPVPEDKWDTPDYREWVRNYPSKEKDEIQILFVRKDLFADDESLKPISAGQWRDDWVRTERRKIEKPQDPDGTNEEL